MKKTSRIETLLNRLLLPQGQPLHSLAAWRLAAFDRLVGLVLTVGLFVVLPSVWLGWQAGFTGLALFDLLAYISVFFVLRSQRLDGVWRARFMVGLVYLVGVVVLVFTGPTGAGLYWMFAFPPLASLLLGARAGVVALALNFLTLVFALLWTWLNVPLLPALHGYGVEGWFVVGINFLLVNAIVTLSTALLVQGLGNTLESQNHIVESLAAERAKLMVVQKIGSQLTAMLSLDTIFEFLYREVIQPHFASPHMVIATYDPETQLIRCRYAVVDDAITDPAQFPVYTLGEGPTSDTIRTGRPRIVNLAAERENLAAHGRIHQIGDDRLPQSALFVPLLGTHGPIGVLSLQSYEAEAYANSDLDLLTTLCAQASIALENASLYEYARQRLSFIESLREIDRAISGSLNLRLMLDSLLRETTTQLGVDAAAVLLLNETNTLAYTAGRGFETRLIESARINLGQGLAGLAALQRQHMRLDDFSNAGELFKRIDMVRAERFVAYNVVPLVAKGVVKGVLEVYHRHPVTLSEEWLWMLETLAGQAAIAVENMHLFDGLKSAKRDLEYAYDRTLEGWVKALEMRDVETGGHTRRVTDLTMRLAARLAVPVEDLPHYWRGALLHDIGKLGIRDSILRKPGPLTEEEWVEMRTHPTLARDWLDGIDYLRKAIPIPWCHHERWDGSGYPHGLKAHEIPLAARIFAVVDVYDALTSDRPYRAAWSSERTLEHIGTRAGIEFDPQVVEAFLALMADDDARN